MVLGSGSPVIAWSIVFLLATSSAERIWSWRCSGFSEETTECLKERTDPSQGDSLMSLEKCKLICGKYGTLMPRPLEATIGKQTIPFLPSQVSYTNAECPRKICPLLDEAMFFFKDTIDKYNPSYSPSVSYWLGPWEANVTKQQLVIEFSVKGEEEYVTLATDESYELNLSSVGAEIKAVIRAPTFFGARHGLETLTQLIGYDEETQSLQIVSSAYIKDAPAFPYRGVIVDTSRNFMNVEKIKKTLDAMSYNKLNSFHWHVTDSHSFPLVINSVPNMAAFGAYSPAEIYSPSDVRDIVQYARVRGIRVVPELDAPAHVGHGWEWGEENGLEKLVLCLAKQPWSSYCVEPPCGQMNLANEYLYDVLGSIYTELADMFQPLELFHYGGDEVHLNCWNTSSEMVQWMTSNGHGLDADAYFRQWSVFQERARSLLTKANKGVEIPGILWTSKLTEQGRADLYLDKTKYIIQIWTNGSDPLIKELLVKGYNVIFSNYDALYLDCGVSSWVGKGSNWCSPYKGWQDIYDNDIQKIAETLTGSTHFFNQILGGEAALWSEQTDSETIEAKLWPRGAALAERLWTNPSTNYSLAVHRILQHRNRLVARGVQASRLQPEWCRQNQGQCRFV